MTAFVPFCEAASLQLARTRNYRLVEPMAWIEISDAELLQCSHHFPIAVRLEGRRPAAGVVLDPTCQRHAVVDENGKWARSYEPIALRCLPFRLRNASSSDPLEALEVAPSIGLTTENGGTAILDRECMPTKDLVRIWNTLRRLKEAEATLSMAIDRLLIADLLVPFELESASTEAASTMSLFVVDPTAFDHLGESALGAMARENFLSLDFAVASIFSQRLLRSEYQPAPRASQPRGGSSKLDQIDVFIPGLDALNLALDDSPLFALEDLDALSSS